jgi:hypothetical protein
MEGLIVAKYAVRGTIQRTMSLHHALTPCIFNIAKNYVRDNFHIDISNLIRF